MSELANIAVGNKGVYHKAGSTPTSINNAVNFSGGVGYYDTSKQLPVGDSTVSQDDYPYHAFNNIVGVCIGNKCITTKPIAHTIRSTNAGATFTINQNSFNGRAFNDYVLKAQHTMWGFETFFKVSSSQSKSYLIQYGYSTAQSVERMAYYKIAVSNGHVEIERRYRNESGWTAAKYQTKSALNMDGNTWYHICGVRIGDGTASHGSGLNASSLIYLKSISEDDIINDNYTWYLDRIKYENSVWHYINGTTYDLATEGFVSIPSDNLLWTFGSQSAERNNYTIDFKQIGDGTARFAKRLTLKGGAFTTQSMNWDINAGTVVFSTTDESIPSFSNSTLRNANGNVVSASDAPNVISEYSWVNSI